ncbi:serologically defined colon cancer antigen 8 homolog isoform X1 [Dendroctonus ponderosae]|uniref:serologically defined colon cancer antigen 8 homolog isoform X1 n=1 Tax=Dendroctonus ponderosae TaxID=77166 RepID=UPI002034E55A|nr:serologically defined colon cancer antigen 8 homolog isoform X1 [Dendroctonus ponderosae]
MDFRRKPDYADTAYREAVGRLRILMAESYTPVRSRVYGTRTIRELDSAGEDTDNQSMISGGSRNSRSGKAYYSYNYTPIQPRKYQYAPLRSNIGTQSEKNIPPEAAKHEPPQPELMSFIERQEDYIEQLEKESRFCKDELSSLLSKVKEVISENEHLHEKQKSKLIKSVFEHLETETDTETEFVLQDKGISKKKRIIEGPSIVFESRISELEAQLTQARIDLRKAQEDNDSLRRKQSDDSHQDSNSCDNFKRQLDNCNRDKEELLNKLKSLQAALSALRNKENDTCDQAKRSLDVAEQAQYEKSAAELEIRRLKDELERQHSKLRDSIAEQGRRIADERSAVERRYTQQIEQLTTEVGVQWETTNKLQLELDKQRREGADLRRECVQKQALIDELKKEMQNKILSLQSDIGVTGAEKSALEQQLSALNLANERTERQYKQEITRLQAEIQSLRQRMDRADADLIHSRRENIRLNEQIASLEKEINLNAALSEERAKSTTPRTADIMALPPPAPKKDDREKELTSMIQDMENKHAATVADLERMIHSQNQLMGKLSSECHALTRKLDDAGHKHKEEIRELQTSLVRLNNKFSQAQYSKTNSKDEDQRTALPSTSPPKMRRSESRSSLKQRSRTSSRQASQEKLSPASTSLQQSPKNAPQAANKEPKSPTDPQTEEKGKNHQQDLRARSQAPEPLQQYTAEEPYGINQEYPPDPHQQYLEDPNQQYLADPHQEYAADPQYQFDPNIQYDPNQQYQEDLQGMYDPNQQYDPSQYQPYNEDTEQQPNQYQSYPDSNTENPANRAS